MIFALVGNPSYKRHLAEQLTRSEHRQRNHCATVFPLDPHRATFHKVN
jgi:hypothetical protein